MVLGVEIVADLNGIGRRCPCESVLKPITTPNAKAPRPPQHAHSKHHCVPQADM